MKKIYRSLLAVLVITAMTLGLTIAASAEGSVTYKGHAEKFIFEPGSEYSATDLFENYKGVMPGDSIEDVVTLRNDESNKVKVKIYMRSLGANEGSEDFLSQMNLSVTRSEDTTLFDASADQQGDLSDWTYIGTLYSGGTVDLNLRLDVPITMGNDCADQIGKLKWQFAVEELPIEPDDPKPPKTGDVTNMMLYAAIMAIAAACMVFLVFMRRRSRSKEE